jgi:hypothetical protein
MMARLGPAEVEVSREEATAVPFRFHGFAVSSFSSLFQKIGHDMDRALGRSVSPVPPAGRCHAAVCPRTFCYLVALLTEVTPYWMSLSRKRSERGTRPVVDDGSAQRVGLDPVV